jgi:hypothetical protein
LKPTARELLDKIGAHNPASPQRVLAARVERVLALCDAEGRMADSSVLRVVARILDGEEDK